MDLSSTLFKFCTIILAILAIFWPEYRTICIIGWLLLVVGYGIGRLAPPLVSTETKPARQP